jgi:uncharacterized protein YdaT
MAKRNQHVVPLGNGWAVRAEGQKTASVITSRQSDAISYAKDIAKKQKSEVLIHGRNGQIREKNSYGKDSYPPRG